MKAEFADNLHKKAFAAYRRFSKKFEKFDRYPPLILPGMKFTKAQIRRLNKRSKVERFLNPVTADDYGLTVTLDELKADKSPQARCTVLYYDHIAKSIPIKGSILNRSLPDFGDTVTFNGREFVVTAKKEPVNNPFGRVEIEMERKIKYRR